jgi:hypothetical protein
VGPLVPLLSFSDRRILETQRYENAFEKPVLN